MAFKSMLVNKPLRIWQISDTHCYTNDADRLVWSPLPVYPNQSLTKLLQHLAAQDLCDALVMSGDIVQEETQAAYQRVKALIEHFPTPIYVLPGNHDIPAFMQTELVGPKIHQVKVSQFNNWHCLFLDTSRPLHGAGYLSAEALGELKQNLEQIPAYEHALIFLHHHPVPIGSPWMNPHGLQEPEQLWEVVTAFPQVKCVGFGHIHNEFAGSVPNQFGQSIAVYGTPATCVQLTHDQARLGFQHANPGWREFLLYPDGQFETTVSYLEL
jgi:Icc protein